MRQALEDHPATAKESIKAELQKLLDHLVFRPCQPEPHATIIPSSLFLKEKFDSSGQFTKMKARFVAGGHRQAWDPSDDCSSPTAAWEGTCLALAAAAHFRLHFQAGDVPTAYLHASRSNTSESPGVFMRIDAQTTSFLLELRPDWAEHCSSNGSLIVTIDKALYGLKDSGKHWYADITRELQGLGLVPTIPDPCIFTRENKGAIDMIIVLYVDDILIFAKTEREIKAAWDQLGQRYGQLEVQPLNHASWLGTTISKDPDGHIFVDCNGYTTKILAKYDVQGCSDYPLPSNFNLKSEPKRQKDMEAVDESDFRGKVMSLMYLAKRCRPDILYACSHLATKCSNPVLADQKALMQLFRYVNQTSTRGIRFSPDIDPVLFTYADASFNAHPDGKSHSGAVIMTCGGPVYFKSSKQKLISKSSSEAEIIACDDAIDMTLWLDQLCNAIGLDSDQPPIVMQDNTSAIQIMEKGKFVKKRGIINVRFGFIRECIEEGRITMQHVGTDMMWADMLTKALHGDKFDVNASIITWDPAEPTATDQDTED